MKRKSYENDDDGFLPTDAPPDGPWETETTAIEVTKYHESLSIGGQPEARFSAPTARGFEVGVSETLPSVGFPYAYFTIENTGNRSLHFLNPMNGHGHVERMVDAKGGLWTTWYVSLCATVLFESDLPPGEETDLYYGGHPIGGAADLTPGRYRLVVPFEGDDRNWVIAPEFTVVK